MGLAPKSKAYHDGNGSQSEFGMRVGIVFDLFDDWPWAPGDPFDADAENEPEATVVALEEALRHLGHEPVRIGTPHDLWRLGPPTGLDAAVNIAEGFRSRNREGWAPTLLEMAGVPFVGSDALTLSLSLDKAWTKDLAAAAGVPTPPYQVFRTAEQIIPEDLPGPFPLFVKPRYEGSAKGITSASRVEDGAALIGAVTAMTVKYGQDAIVEPFVTGGGEFTVAIVGHRPPRALPVLQRAVDAATGIGLHALERKGLAHADRDWRLEGRLDAGLESTMTELALRVFEKLECRDFARIDFRVDEAGKPWFLEINPLPTFDPDGTFAILAELCAKPYPEFLADVLKEALARIAPGP